MSEQTKEINLDDYTYYLKEADTNKYNYNYTFQFDSIPHIFITGNTEEEVKENGKLALIAYFNSIDCYNKINENKDDIFTSKVFKFYYSLYSKHRYGLNLLLPKSLIDKLDVGIRDSGKLQIINNTDTCLTVKLKDRKNITSYDYVLRKDKYKEMYSIDISCFLYDLYPDKDIVITIIDNNTIEIHQGD